MGHRASARSNAVRANAGPATFTGRTVDDLVDRPCVERGLRLVRLLARDARRSASPSASSVAMIGLHRGFDPDRPAPPQRPVASASFGTSLPSTMVAHRREHADGRWPGLSRGHPTGARLGLPACRSPPPTAGESTTDPSWRVPLVARNVPAVDRAPAVEVGHPAAGLLDEHERRRDVPGLETDLDHRLGGALGHERVAPEVAEAAVAPGVAG